MRSQRHTRSIVTNYPTDLKQSRWDERERARAGAAHSVRVETSVLLFFFSLIFFRLVLDIGLITFGADMYHNYYLPLRIDFDSWQYVFSLALYSLSLINLRSYDHSPSNVFQLMASMFVTAPLTSQFGLDAARPVEPVVCTILALWLVKLISEIEIFNPKNQVKVNQSRYFAIGLSVLGIVFLLAWSVVSGAAGSFNLDPALVYDFRDKSSELMDVGALAYFNAWVYKAFTLYLICFCLEKRQYFLIIPLLAVQIYFGGVSNHKSVIFMPVMIIGFWYFLSRTRKLYPIPIAAAILVAASIATYLFWDLTWGAEILLRRTFFVPSGATFAWFEFFNFQPYVYWSDRILSAFVETTYSGGPAIPYVIGEWLFPGNSLAANNGLVSSGYSHAGYFGIAFYAFIMGLILNIINYLARTGVELWMAVALTLVPLRTALGDSDLFTAILTHGIFVSVVLLWMHRRASAAKTSLHGSRST
jgi:hypothetical protein